ncbi:hypothetical protein [Streptomyces sp. NPDC056707]|uniref:hypothetical protein n=1 Tax=Streptomyces sp. NPDC056707 TaxID=3345919 RepID=UPI003683EE87
MDNRPTPGALGPNRPTVLEEALELFEADLNPDDPVHRQAAQLSNLCLQAFSEYAKLMAEANEHLPKAARDRIIPVHQERALEGLSRLREIVGVEDE